MEKEPRRETWLRVLSFREPVYEELYKIASNFESSTQGIIDFCISSAGFLLERKEQGFKFLIADKSGRGKVVDFNIPTKQTASGGKQKGFPSISWLKREEVNEEIERISKKYKVGEEEIIGWSLGVGMDLLKKKIDGKNLFISLDGSTYSQVVFEGPEKAI